MSAARLDHLVLATQDLERTARAFAERTGTTPSIGGVHPGFGTRNVLVALGPDSYLEIIGPDPGQPKPLHGRPFGIDDLRSERLRTWAVKSSDLEGERRRAAEAGLHLGPIRAMSRSRPDGTVLSWRLTLPSVLPAGGVVPFLIDWGATDNPARTAATGCRLLKLEAYHPDPEHARSWLSALDVDLPVATGPVRLIATLDTPRGEFELG